MEKKAFRVTKTSFINGAVRAVGDVVYRDADAEHGDNLAPHNEKVAKATPAPAAPEDGEEADTGDKEPASKARRGKGGTHAGH